MMRCQWDAFGELIQKYLLNNFSDKPNIIVSETNSAYFLPFFYIYQNSKSVNYVKFNGTKYGSLINEKKFGSLLVNHE